MDSRELSTLPRRYPVTTAYVALVVVCVGIVCLVGVLR